MNLSTPSLSTLALLSLFPLASAQTRLPFSARVLPGQASARTGILDLEPDPVLLAQLTQLSAVVLTDFALPDGTSVDLALERRAFDPSRVGVQVDGRRADFDPLDLTLWGGSIEDVPGSQVSLSFSSHGSYGWIDDGARHVNLTSFPSPTDGWSRAGMRLYGEEALLAAQTTPGPVCESDSLLSGPAIADYSDPRLVPAPSWAGATLECPMAIETDHQLYQLWGDLQAEQSYVLALLAALSARYEEQIDTVLSFPYVQFYTAPSDPWTTQDTGGGSGDLLNEFRAAWANNIPAGAKLAHFLSGAGLGGGVAWVNTICSGDYGFAVSGNINGGVSFPVNQGSNTWDFFVAAHETGHNFGTLHTHDYCPPLDECSTNCNNQITCTSQGTIMSYCHGCPGGMINITTYFHPTVVGVMRAAAEASCLADLNGTVPVLLFSDDFESGSLASGGWQLSNLPAQVLPEAAKEGALGCRIRNKRWIEKSLDTTGHATITLEVWRRSKNYDLGESLRIRMHDGSSWTTLEEATAVGWGRLQVELPASAGNNQNLRLRFKSSGSQGNERGDIDGVAVYGQ